MSEILNAVEEVNFQEVKRLVESGAKINEKDDDDNTVLHYAISSGSQEIVEYLVEHGADVNFKNVKEETALQFAADHDSLGIVKYLIKHGADIHCKSVENNTALHYAAYSGSLEVVKYLINECGADVNCKNNDDKSPLHYAAELNSLEMIRDLVERGADVNCRSKSNDTALNHAIKAGALHVVEYLVEHHANVNFKYDLNETALHYAVESKSLEIVKYLVEKGAEVNCKTKRGATVLHFAVRTGSLEIVKYLVEHCEMKVTTKQHRGEKTVLYWACRQGNESTVEYLLQNGAMEDVYELDRLQRSCLGNACYKGNTDLVRTFLKFGVDIRRETELLCGNEEIVSTLNLELKSRKHREKIEKLKALDDKDLTQVRPPLKRFCHSLDFSLGKGCGGTHVYVGIMEDGSLVAVKTMLITSSKELAENENDILSLVKTERSPFIVNYREFLQQSMFMYLILDLCEESLRKHVESKSIEYLRECGPRMIKQILSGLEFLHDHNILHRDLKPSNVLVDITGRMRLADFGLSRVLDDDQSTFSTCPRGTVGWVPPEVIKAINEGIEKKGRFKKKSDVHVAGMIAFFILSGGEHPFGNPFDRMTNILEGKPLNLENLEDLEAKDFISWMICKNIWNRPDAGEALRHRFLAQVKMYEELSEPRILLVGDDSD